MAVLPPLPNSVGEVETLQQINRRADRERRTTESRQQAALTAAQPQPQIALPAETADILWELVHLLPHSILVLTHFTITAASDGLTLCRSHSFGSQQSLDEAISTLPLDTPLHVTGRAAGFNHRHHMFDGDVSISFSLTLHQTNDGMVTKLHNTSDATMPANLPRLARVDESSVQLTTSFRLLPSLTIPLAARLCLITNDPGDPKVEFEVVHDSSNPLSHSPLQLPDVLDYHRERVMNSSDDGHRSHPGQEQYQRNSVFPLFASQCPTVHLSSFVLVFAPASYQLITLSVEVQSETNMQLRGFHLVQPRLQFQLLDRLCGEQRSLIRGRAEATYTVLGSGTTNACSVDVSIKALPGPDTMTVTGDCLNVMRVADILAANIGIPAPQSITSAAFASCAASPPLTPTSLRPPPLSSLTTLPWTLESLLARQLPWLTPTDPPTPPPERVRQHESIINNVNSLSCEYCVENHSIYAVGYRNLTFGLTPNLALTLSTSSITVLLSTRRPRRDGMEYAHFQLRPFLYFHSEGVLSCQPADSATLGLMSFTQLLTLIGLPTDTVHPALHDHVQFGKVTAALLVLAATGVAVCVAGTAECGPSRRDELLFYNRLVPAAAPAAESCGMDDRAAEGFTKSPINRWLQLQCRPVLDSAVFPQLAALTTGRCLEPLYQYVLCETEGGVELSEEQTAFFEHSHYSVADPQQWTSFYPLKARPTNSVFALQLHLPSGYLELPTTALSLPALPARPHHSASTPSSADSSSLSEPSRLLVALVAGSVELFRLCVDYLDTNSVLFGLLPAAHSLPAVAAALSSSKYGRRVLVSRYGAWSDAGMWHAELLGEWRRDGFEQQKAEVKVKHRDRASAEQLCAQQAAANQYDVYWAAVIDLQRRINRFLVGVMLQKKEDVLPQLYERPHASTDSQRVAVPAPPGTVRPVYLTSPDAAMELLLCVPPFHPLPSYFGPYAVSTLDECSIRETTVNNSSPHHIDFAGFMSWTFSDDKSLWSLYTGPVYVYESEYTAGRGCEVDLAEVMSRKCGIGQRLAQGKVDRDRGVRQMLIDDVNQLPVTRRMHGGSDDIRLYAPTLRACFTAKKVIELIQQTRAKWRRLATQHTEWKDGEADEQDNESDSNEDDMAESYDSNNDEEHNFAEDSAMDDRDGAVVEYVEPLMEVLFIPLHDAMYEQPRGQG